MARYEGLADWYDDQFPSPFAEAVADVVRDLLGRGDGECLDVGCGGGHYVATIAALGWRVTGLDESEDQLRVAGAAAGAVGAALVKGDATALPFHDASFDAVTALMVSTDIEPYERVVGEAGRVLRPGAPFVHVGVHPCFAGPHTILRDDGRMLGTGYRSRAYKRTSPAFSPVGIRARVGASHVPLDDLLNAVVTSGLRLERVIERWSDPPVMLALLGRREPA